MQAPWTVTPDMFLSWAEQRKLLAFLDRLEQDPEAAEIDPLIIRTLLFSGLKTTEFCNLRVADFILNKSESAIRVSGTPREDRQVHIPRTLALEIDDYRRRVRPGLLHESLDRRDPELPLFLNDRGRHFDRTALYRRVVKILTAAGLADRASVQLLRHTYGFRAYTLSHGNLLFVQRQMGHAHPMVTSVYAQFADEDYSAIADAVMLTPRN